MRVRSSLAVAAAAAVIFGPCALGDDAPSPLLRRGCLGVQVTGVDDGVLVAGVIPDGPAERAGLHAMDRIVAIDGVRIDGSVSTKFLRGRIEGEHITLTILREGKEFDVRAALVAPRTPDLPGVLTEFGEVTLADGSRMRTILTVPFRATDDPMQAILFIPNTDCATIDPEIAQSNGWFDLIETTAQSGYVTMRIDKPGVGDSEGTDCGSLDYLEEIAVYRAALAALLANPGVDPTKVFLVATRGGTTIAPVLAREVDFAGVCVIGPVVRPWYEHTLGLIRRQARDWNMPPLQAEKMAHDCAELLARVMMLGEEPAAIVKEHPELAQLAQSLGGDRLFGRCAAFHHQLNDADLAAAWSLLDTNVLVARGEYDRSCTPEDQDLVAQLVNGALGSHAWTITIPRTDPEMSPQQSPDYFRTKWSAVTHGPNPELAGIVLDWLTFAAANDVRPPSADPAADPALQVDRDESIKPSS